jgi:phage tail protein X
MVDRVLQSRQGDTVDGLLWREMRLGPQDLGPIFDANPGLAQLGPVLPLGTAVRVPITTTAAPTILPLIQIWD